MATTKEETNEVTNDSSSKIEAIKNLIFGENIQAYDSEFEELKKDLVSKRNELKSFIDETSRELNTLIDNLSTDLNIRITDLENKVSDKVDILESKKVDKKALGDLLVKLGNKISE